MDDADRAEGRIEDTVTDSLDKVRRRMEYRELEPVHACHWCGEKVEGRRLFCNKQCSDDYEKDKRFHGK